MKRTPKKPPKPPSAAEVAAEERQRMISSDLEQIRRYIGEIARILKGYREENVALRANLAETETVLAKLQERWANRPVTDDLVIALRQIAWRTMDVNTPNMARAWADDVLIARAALRRQNGATEASEGQAAAQTPTPSRLCC